MPISRRQFFSGFTGPGENKWQGLEQRRVALEAYVRANILPYDFALTAQQTEEVLAAVRAGTDIDDGGELFSKARCARILEIAEVFLVPWRDAHWRAQEVRSHAAGYARRFLETATTDERERLQQRFPVPFGNPDEEAFVRQIEHQVRVWMAEFSDEHILQNAEALRELVFSQIRSWC